MPVYAINKKARFDYEIEDTFEAGLVLTGQEAKSVRKGGAKLTGAFVTFYGETPLMTNLHISKYQFASDLLDYDPTHSRRLLLKKKQAKYLRGKSEERGLTLVPLSLYTKGPYIKVEVAVARGKKKFDKRESIKKRDVQRELDRGRKGKGKE